MGSVLAKRMVVLAVVSLGAMAALAIPAHPGLGTVRQPDGTEVRVRLHGDKWCHWHEDEDGYTVMREPVSKEWVYADVDDEGESVPTTLRVGKADPSRTLKKGVRAKRQLSRAGKARAKTLQQVEPQKTSTKGTLRNLVVLVQFPDLKFRYGKSDFENLYNQTGYSTSGAAGSVRDYYREVSYGQLNLESVIAGPVTVSRNYAEYGENASDVYAVKDMVAEALSLLERQGFDFSRCDVDGDGEIDGLDIIHAGYGAEFNGNSADYIWSHKWQMRTAVTYDGVRMYKYHTESEIHGRESSPSSNRITSIGVICHETGHFLGLPDLYDTDSSSAGIGDFCIMAGGSWNEDGKCPAHMSAWCKVNLGWVTPTVISTAGNYTLPRVEDNRKIYKIRGNFASQSEYFLFENRQGYGFDAALPGSNRGILIWHVDERQSDNANENHFKVDLEEASGTQNLQLGTSSGDDSDYWRSTTKAEFSASTTPNTSSYSGEALGLSISAISASGDTMSFRATVGNGGGSTVPLGTALDNTSLTFTTGGSASWAGQTSLSHDGTDAARSGALGHGQQCWMQTTVTGAGTVSFWWYASSEANYDYLEFLVDGEVKASMSGTSNSWTSKSFSITTPGSHTLQWRYRKDGSVSSGDDAGFVDQVVWNASASATPDLSFTTRTGWSAPVVVSASSANATNATVTSFKSTEPLYISWSIKCRDADIASKFYSRLLVDGVQQMQWYTSGLKADHVAWVMGYGVGKLSVGTHTIKVVTDSTGVVGESNENNNTYTKTITVVRGNVPGNDDFSAATWLNGSYGEATGSNVDATSQSGEPLPQYKSSAQTSVWWKWTAPSSGTVRFATEGSSFDTVMGVYTGYALSSLTVKAQDDDGGSNRTSVCTFSAVAGMTYYICVAGYKSASGTVKLSWRPAQTLVVKLNANGGTLSGVAWKPVRKSAAVGSLKKPTRAGYTFAGWYTKKSGGTKVTSKKKITKAVTFYAHWKAKKYTVTLKKTGKGTVSGGGKKAYKAKITLVAKPASGYVFQGWYKNGTLVSSKAKWNTTVPLSGATYTAKFVKRSATSAAVEAKDVEEDSATESAAESLPAPAAGTYDGWSYAEDAVGEFLPARKITVVVTSDGKISAKVGSLKFSGDWHEACTGRPDAKDGTATVVLRAVRTVGTGADAQYLTDVLTLAFDADADWTVDQLTGVLATYKDDVTVEEAKGLEPVNDDTVLSARRNAFGENEEAQALAAELAARGVLKLVDGDGLVWLVKVAENGVATVLRDSDGDGAPVTATAVVAAQDLDDGKLCAVVRFPSSDRVVTIVVK